jgi:hypothetical protein
MLGNKGGVGVSCKFAGVRLLLITSHLAAHDECVERRNADFQRIYCGLFGQEATSGNVAVAADPDGASSQSSLSSTNATLSAAPHLASEEGADTPHIAQASPVMHAASIPGRLSRLAAGSSLSQMSRPARSAADSPTSVSVSPPTPTTHASSGSIAAKPAAVRQPRRPMLCSQLDVADPSASVLPLHDIVLWSGDLNYRINGTIPVVSHLLSNGMAEVLHANDQLRIQMRKGRVFRGFHEQAIHFPPTFKYKPGNDVYSGKRVPSWTDRVLHATYGHSLWFNLEPLFYRCACEGGW